MYINYICVFIYTWVMYYYTVQFDQHIQVKYSYEYTLKKKKLIHTYMHTYLLCT